MSRACGLVRADGSCRSFSAYTVLPFNVTAFDLLRNLLRKQGQDCNSHFTDQIDRRATCPRKWFLAQSWSRQVLPMSYSFPIHFALPGTPFPIRGVTGLLWRRDYLKYCSCLTVELICGSWRQKDLSLNVGTAI